MLFCLLKKFPPDRRMSWDLPPLFLLRQLASAGGTTARAATRNYHHLVSWSQGIGVKGSSWLEFSGQPTGCDLGPALLGKIRLSGAPGQARTNLLHFFSYLWDMSSEWPQPLFFLRDGLWRGKGILDYILRLFNPEKGLHGCVASSQVQIGKTFTFFYLKGVETWLWPPFH